MTPLLGQIPDPTKVVETATGYSWEAGLLCFVVVTGFIGLGIAAWKITWYAVHKIFGDEAKGTVGLAGEWVKGELAWRNTLTERLERQTDACSGHIETVRALGDSLAAQIEAAKLAQDAATKAAAVAAESNESLRHIDDVLGGRTEMLRRTAEGVRDLKQCVFHMCDLCQLLVSRGFPDSIGEVSAYLTAIKKTVNDDRAMPV